MSIPLLSLISQKMRVTIEKITKEIEVLYNGEKIILPESLQAKIDAHWNELLESGKKFFTRGEVFTIAKVEETTDKIIVEVAQTDYAHYVYTLYSGIFDDLSCRVIHTSALIETSDKRIIIGEMGSHTASPGKLQCVGGGIDKGDIFGEKFDMLHNITKELQEEVGIDVADENIVKDIKPFYFKKGGSRNSLGLIFMVRLKISEEEFKRHYQKFVAGLQEDPAEFNSLVILEENQKAFDAFCLEGAREKDDYLIPLLLKFRADEFNSEN